ncbi:MAG TPA: twin-arginine translocase subunit TatC [Parachlamydiaceae bacterium]|nr:twin-arginine translocase subunit TatC [Parachlamydiaceae bacterium]
MDEHEAFASFWGHVEDLRRTLLRMLLIILSAVVICFICYEPIIAVLTKPLKHSKSATPIEERLEYIRVHNSESTSLSFILPAKSLLSHDLSYDIEPTSEFTYLISPGGSLVYAKTAAQQNELVVLGPLEGILIALKTSLWVGAFISSPLWLLVLAQFFLPGLRAHEKNLILPFIITSLVFVITGCLFAYLLTIPMANHYLVNFNEGIGINLWSLGNYLEYTLFLLMANGIAFELGAIGIFAVHLKFLSAETLRNNRRFAILGAFMIATFLTPPDVLTQFMLAIPLIGLYEALIFYASALARLRKVDVN